MAGTTRSIDRRRRAASMCRTTFIVRRRSKLPLLLGVVASALPAVAFGQLTYLNSWGTTGAGNGQFEAPYGVAVSPTGTVYVADLGNARIETFSSTGTFQSTFGIGYVEEPAGVAVGSTGTVYVTDGELDRVATFSSSGTFQNIFGSSGTGNGQFNNPLGVAVGPTGTVYVADGGNDRVETFSSTGTFQSTFGSAGTGNGEFIGPDGAAVGPTGTVYVVDSANQRIETFSSTGTFQSTFGSIGNGNGEFDEPDGVAVGPTGTVYVTDTYNNRIETFSSTGTFQSTFGSYGTGNGEFEAPVGVAVAPTGMVYVGEAGGINRIDRLFDPSSWTSGTNSFANLSTGPTSVGVGPGQLLGTSLTLTSAMGLGVGNTLTVYSGGTFNVSGGTLTAATITQSGGTFADSSTLALVTGGNAVTYNLNGGTLAIPSVSVGRGGAFNWTAGTLNLTNSSLTVGTGGPLGSSLTLGSGQTLQISGTAQSLSVTGTLNLNGGAVSTPSVSISGSYVVTSGTTSTQSIIVQSGGSFSAGVGSSLTLSGEPTTITVDSGGTFNTANLNLTLASGETLSTSGGPTYFPLSSLTVNFGASFSATQGGVVALSGTSSTQGEVILDGGTSLSETATLQVNSGGLLSVGNATVSAGTSLTVASAGEVQLSNALNANIISPNISNSGLIEGSGRINGALQNYGDVNAGSGESMTVLGASAINESGGQISLTGGTIEFSQALSNSAGAYIDGYGTFRADAGLTNSAGGYVSFGGGSQTTNVFGTIANSGNFSVAGSVAVFGTINNNTANMEIYSSPNVFYGAVNNNAGSSVTVNPGASVEFLGPYTGSSPIDDLGSADFLAASTSGSIVGGGDLAIGATAGAAGLKIIPSSGVSVISSVAISGGTKLDLTNNDLIVKNGSLAGVFGQIKAGANFSGGGYWNGMGGIVSSTAASNAEHLTALGYRQSAGGVFDGVNTTTNDVLVKYTYYGDANLDGVVNGADYQQIDHGFGLHLSGWSNGDFNYDGVVDGSDYSLIDNTFNQLTASGAGPLALTTGSADLIASPTTSSVPEPTGLGFLGIGAIRLLVRRRRDA